MSIEGRINELIESKLEPFREAVRTLSEPRVHNAADPPRLYVYIQRPDHMGAIAVRSPAAQLAIFLDYIDQRWTNRQFVHHVAVSTPNSKELRGTTRNLQIPEGSRILGWSIDTRAATKVDNRLVTYVLRAEWEVQTNGGRLSRNRQPIRPRLKLTEPAGGTDPRDQPSSSHSFTLLAEYDTRPARKRTAATSRPPHQG